MELYADDVPIDVAQKLLFRLGRAYPAYWEADGSGGHCPWSCEWLAADGRMLSRCDYGNRDKYLAFVCQQCAPAVAAHWEHLLSPLVLCHSDSKGIGLFRQLEYYRMPYMAFLAFDDPNSLSRADCIRLALGAKPVIGSELPYAQSYLAKFEENFSYDRYCHTGPELDAGGSGTRLFATGQTLVVIADAQDPNFMRTTFSAVSVTSTS